MCFPWQTARTSRHWSGGSVCSVRSSQQNDSASGPTWASAAEKLHWTWTSTQKYPAWNAFGLPHGSVLKPLPLQFSVSLSATQVDVLLWTPQSARVCQDVIQNYTAATKLDEGSRLSAFIPSSLPSGEIPEQGPPTCHWSARLGVWENKTFTPGHTHRLSRFDWASLKEWAKTRFLMRCERCQTCILYTVYQNNLRNLSLINSIQFSTSPFCVP